MPSSRAAALALLLLAAPALLPAAAQGPSSLGITPPSVDLADAQRGQTYAQQVEVQNEFDSPTTVTYEPAGEVGNWTSASPPSGFQVPARDRATIDLSIQVPSDAPNGLHTGYLQLVAEPKSQPNGSGFALRYAVAVVLNVTVGGEAIVKLRWLDARAEDVEVGSPPLVFARVVNEGNVRTVARATAQVMGAGAPVLPPGTASLDLVPGATEEMPFQFQGNLPRTGPFTADVASSSGDWRDTAAFEVKELGQLGKDGALRFLQHEPWVDATLPVKVIAAFDNTGKAPIAAAKLTAEVYLEDKLVAALTSDALHVGVGQRANLSAFFTPTLPGTYRILGKVTYDGIETQPNESVLNVRGASVSAAGGELTLPPWLLAAVLGLVVVGAIAGALRSRKRHGPRRRW